LWVWSRLASVATAVYLVTGAAGFIGANDVHRLVEWEPDADVAVNYLGFAGHLDYPRPVRLDAVPQCQMPVDR
jgi:dTDP-glucose 4,6-dehydratase